MSSRALQITEASGRGQRVGVARLSRRAHNPETGGSNPPLATKLILEKVDMIERIKLKLKVKNMATAC